MTTLAEASEWADDPVVTWRIKVLVEAGFTNPQAVTLAVAKTDLHQAVKLLARGCPRDVAFDILS